MTSEIEIRGHNNASRGFCIGRLPVADGINMIWLYSKSQGPKLHVRVVTCEKPRIGRVLYKYMAQPLRELRRIVYNLLGLRHLHITEILHETEVYIQGERRVNHWHVTGCTIQAIYKFANSAG